MGTVGGIPGCGFDLKWLKWRGRTYKIEKLGLHHTYHLGRVLWHVFSVTGGKMFFRLAFNSENLNWVLEEVADGEIG